MSKQIVEKVEQIRDAFLQARWALRDNALRTLLSMIGILIGVVAVMAVGTVTQTIRHTIFSELESFGLNTIWIYRDSEKKDPFKTVRQGSGITNDDLLTINAECCPDIVRLSPEVYYSDWNVLVRNGSRYEYPVLRGVGGDFLELSRDKLSIGRNFRPEDISYQWPVAIIGPQVNESLFGKHSNPVGKSLRIEDVKVTVIGLLEEKSRDFLNNIGITEDSDINNRVLIPYTTHQKMLNTKEIQSITAEALSTDRIQPAIDQVITHLERRHDKRYSYKSDSMETWIESANRILRNISILGLLAASISLVVGGIGIMNIMTTSVMERTNEIGIRKAIGARNSDILYQFLLEAVAISAIGGLFGLITGYILSYSVTLFTGIPAIPPLSIVFIALVVSMAVGIASGYYPALRASALRPVEALRT